MPSNTSWVANGNISASVFVYAATSVSAATATNQFAVSVATGTGTPIVGISQMGTRGPVGTPFDTGYAAADGDQIMVFDNTYEDECLLILGQPVTAGQLLTSDSSGRGIPTSATGQWFGAMAKQTQSTTGVPARVRPYFGISG
jgi:hypothetical protein